MKTSQGKIITVVGGPGVGKSTLVRYLADKYKVKAFYEGEEDTLPEYIKQNIGANKNRMQTIIYFQNLTVNQYLEALKLSQQGHHVVLDTFWLSNLFYVNDYTLKDRNEQQLTKEMIDLSRKKFGSPDVIVYLKADDDLVLERLQIRDRSFEKESLESFLQVNRDHEDYFKDDKYLLYLPQSKLITVNAKNFDYDQVAEKLKLSK